MFLENNYDERAVLIAFSAVTGVGRVTLLKIETRLKKCRWSWSELWGEIVKSSSRKTQILANVLSEKQVATVREFNAEHSPAEYQQLLTQKNVHVLLASDALYPTLLKQIPDYPLVLYAKGLGTASDGKRTGVGWWQHHPIAVVGTRKMTSYRQLVTEMITQQLAVAGTSIISGFMYGVDVTAHAAALAAAGNTLGVLGFGFDWMYPAGLRPVFEDHLQQGQVFFSEYPPETPPQRGFFVRRNRIVAGMSLGVVVTEAALKSGTTTTVEAALEYGRTVMAVPGPITSPFSLGTMALLNQGAVLVSSGEDVLKELGLSSSSGLKIQQKSELDDLDPISKSTINQLKIASMTTDQLAIKLSLAPNQLAISLTVLELKKLISRAGPYWSLAARMTEPV